jgi:hypothetical protein
VVRLSVGPACLVNPRTTHIHLVLQIKVGVVCGLSSGQKPDARTVRGSKSSDDNILAEFVSLEYFLLPLLMFALMLYKSFFWLYLSVLAEGPSRGEKQADDDRCRHRHS